MKPTITKDTPVALVDPILEAVKVRFEFACEDWAGNPTWETRREVVSALKTMTRLTMETREAMGR